MKSRLLTHPVKPLRYTLIASLVLFVVSLTCNGAPQQYITIEQIGTDHLIYDQYSLTQTQREDLSDLILSDKIIGKTVLPSSLNLFWSQKPDFKLMLLSVGLARLKNFDAASEEYRVAQETAKKEGKGDWEKPSEPAQSPSTATTPSRRSTPTPDESPEGPSVISQIGTNLYNWGKALWDWIVSPLGIMSAISAAALAYLYRRFYIQRRLRLLIIGEPSAGKTALYLRLLNPGIEEETILKLGPTPALQKMVGRNFIPHGKYEIHPRLTDVPGGTPAYVWDELTGFWFRWFWNPHALVVTLATTIEKSSNGDSKSKSQSYLDTQLGYVRAFIEGAMGARRTRKPKAIILYLNKFDLFSSLPPTDTTAGPRREQFKHIFADHISSAELAAKKAGIKFHVVIGSALKNWNCEELIKTVGRTLYGS